MIKSNILVTGGAGFIGSNIVEYLLNNNTKFVRIVDNLSTGHKKNIDPFLKKYNNLEFINGDITDINVCRNVTKNIDIICHQAALGSVPRSIIDPLSSHSSNVNGFLNILVAAKENGIKRVVYASSSSVYGDSKALPKKEDSIGKPLSPYAGTKLIDEIYADIFTKCYGMECIGLRYFNIFGPRQDPNGPYAAVIPKFINLMKNGETPVINGDGSYSRDFTYVDNAVLANVLAMTTTNKECFGNNFNIGTNDRTTLVQLFDYIKIELGSSLEPIFGPNRPGDIPHSLADISKAKQYLNYNVVTDFKTGLKNSVKYFLDFTPTDE